MRKRTRRRGRPAEITDVYRLRLPSGGVVRVRKATPLALAACGLFATTLLHAAIVAVSSEEVSDGAQRVASVGLICKACLVDAVAPEDLTWVDRLAVHAWATAAGEDGAEYEGSPPLTPDLFVPLVQGPGALMLHHLCEMYGTRPSDVLGIGEDRDLALSLDVAIAFRGIRRDQSGAEGIVAAKDMYGGVHHVPGAWLSGGTGPSVIDADTYAKYYGECTLSAGSNGNAAGDGMIGPMPGADGLRDWERYVQ